MSRINLRQRPRISYYEPEEPSLDEYVFCDECGDHVFEYCAIHGALLVVPDDKVPAKTNLPTYVPRAALTIPHVFLHLAPSTIPGAGLGVFTTLTLPRGVRFGPYRGQRCKEPDSDSMYCWQIYDRDRKPSHVVDASDANKSNWMRYVNCARHWCEQNLVAYQYQGQLYYRTIKLIPRHTEIMVFYGSEFAHALGIDLRRYNSPAGYAQKLGAPVAKKPRFDTKQVSKKSNKKSEESNQNIQDASPRNENQQNTINTTDKGNQHNSSQAAIKPRFTSKTAKKLNKKSEELNKNAEKGSKKNEKHNDNNKEPKGTGSKENSSVAKEINSDLNNNPENNTFKCNDCNETFQTKDYLTQHLKKHVTVSGPKEIVKKTSKFNSKYEENPTVTPMSCDICEFVCVDVNVLNTHLMTRHAGKKPDSISTLKCDKFQYSCDKKSQLKVHNLEHKGKTPFMCKQCDYKTVNKCNLEMHIRTHTGEKPYVCDICNKRFARKSDLNSHKRTHTGEKPYVCEVCNKRFSSSSDLIKHKRTHTGEKPYVCDVCNKRFTQIGNLISHKRTHTGEKPYVCDMCTNRFAHQNSLITHKRTHTGEKPYVCDMCDTRFPHKKSLIYHKRTHTGEKPYVCDVCNKRFTVSSNLIAHKRTHTGEKPYVCDMCNNGFLLKKKLIIHMTSHKGSLIVKLNV